MTVFRDGKEQEIKVTVGSNKATEEKQATAANETRLGVTTRPLTKEEEKKAETTGLLVTQLPVPPPRQASVRADILVSADGKLLKSRDDLLEQCKDNKVLLLVATQRRTHLHPRQASGQEIRSVTNRGSLREPIG